VVAAQGAAALLAPVWATISAAGSAVWGTIESAATTAFNAISSVASAAISAVIETVGSLVSGVVEAFTGATGEVAAAADAIAAAIARATEAAGDIEGAGELAARLVEPFEQASSRIGEIMDGIRALVASGFAAIRTEVGSIAASIDAMISRIISALRRAAAEAARLRAQASSGGGGSSSARGLAGGGQVRGAGTATSDSILAWLSDGEFVMRTAAVRKYGPALMAAINSLSLPKDFFRGFNLGGLVDGLSGGFAGMAPQPALALAGGGFAEPAGPSGTPIVINLPGGQTIAALAQESPASIAGKLSQYIGGRSVASTGRKPGWRR
jgi:hypothetical protein